MKSNETIAENMSRGIIYLHPRNKILTAFKVMDDHGIKHIPVLDDNKLVGMVSDRDVLLHINIKKTNNQDEILEVPDIYLEQICSSDLITISPFDSIQTAAQLMLTHEIDSLPVVNGSRELIGIITSSDLLKFIADQKSDASNETVKIQDFFRQIPINHGDSRLYQ